MAEEKEIKEYPLQYIKGVGPKRAEAFAAEGILSLTDLVTYFPRSYIDRSASESLKDLAHKLAFEDMDLSSKKFQEYRLLSEVSIIAKIADIREHEFGKRRKMLKLILSDGSSGKGQIVFWQGADYFKKRYKIGQMLSISGKPDVDNLNVVTFNHPDIEIIDEEDTELYSSGVILPKYKLTENMIHSGITMRSMRGIMQNILSTKLPGISESLPGFLLEKHRLPGIQETISQLHFPTNTESISRARFRIKFEELFYYQLSLAIKQHRVKAEEMAPAFDKTGTSARRLYDSLPFKLTGDQKKVIREIADDLKIPKPMNRLLQGDVGSGKTIVALLTMLIAIDNGSQVAIMAPTELLAEQHFRSISRYLEGMDIKVSQLVGGMKARYKREVLEGIASGDTNIIVGTHAMFESEINYCRLGYIIIDEQHRFGVAQRAELKRLAADSFPGGGISPHILVMTATPIPRTLSMTLYGDLDVSIIREMPKNRKPIITRVTFESQMPVVYDFIKKQLDLGRQAYIVYPLVEKSEKLELKAATEHFEFLRANVFEQYTCGLLHGQMFWYEKDEAMKDFLSLKYQVLVATTVIEVGIDVPNATIMLIENAERFGLSQLHQLRGRVGRGSEQSYCILATKEHFKYHIRKEALFGEDRKAAIIRLKTMEETTDGFKIAETDLMLRGPGDMLGTRQTGLPDFKYTDLTADGDIISLARNEARSILDKDMNLKSDENRIIRTTLERIQSSHGNFFGIA